MTAQKNQPQPPRLPAAPEPGELRAAVALALEREEDVTGRLFREEAWEAAALDRLEFRGCVFENCRLPGGVFSRVNFTDVLFRGCDLSGMDWQACAALRVRVEA